MKNRSRAMKQLATYWPPAANDGFGSTGHGAPESLMVRWQDKAELFQDAEGQEVTSSAVVYSPEPLELEGYLFLGSSVVADPRNVKGAKKIRQKGSSPNLRATQTLNKVWL